MRKFYLLICLLLGLFSIQMSSLQAAEFGIEHVTAGVSESASTLTLQQALDLALQANPDIAVAMREREAIEGVKTQAAVRPNPTASLSLQDTRSDTRQTFLQLSQELELGGKRAARIAVADSLSSKADAELEHKKAEIHANVVAAFYEVLVAQERLNLANSSQEVARLALDASAKRVKAGKSSRWKRPSQK